MFYFKFSGFLLSIMAASLPLFFDDSEDESDDDFLIQEIIMNNVLMCNFWNI